jgi:hypothetical protein
MTRWTNPETRAHLANLSARGLSAGKIAAALGESRNAVAGAMNRYQLFSETRARRPQADNSSTSNERNS